MKDSKKKKNIFCVCGSIIFIFCLDFQTIGTNLQTSGYFAGMSYTGTKFHHIFWLELILLNISNALDIY